MQDSPSLRGRLAEIVAAEHPRGVRLAGSGLRLYGEAARVPLEGLRFTFEQVLGPQG